jgi:cytochrome c
MADASHARGGGVTHLAFALAALSLATTAPFLVAGCGSGDERRAAAYMTGGNPDVGKAKIRSIGCGACHTVPGVPGANATVGPSLAHIASQTYIAGVLRNEPDNMLRWLQNPPGVDPKTAMPHLNLSEQDARDVAGYLYTLK